MKTMGKSSWTGFDLVTEESFTTLGSKSSSTHPRKNSTSSCKTLYIFLTLFVFLAPQVEDPEWCDDLFEWFQPAIQEVKTLIIRDSWPRFVNSEFYDEVSSLLCIFE